MTSPAVHVPATPVADRIRTPLLVSLAIGALIATGLTFAFTTSDPAPAPAPATSTASMSSSADEVLLNQAARVSNAAGATTPGVIQEATRQQVLEELYRINGVYPPEPVVPPAAR